MPTESKTLQLGCCHPLGHVASTYADLFAEKSPVAGLDVVCERHSSPWRKVAWVVVMIPFCCLTVSGWQSAIGSYFAFDITVSLESSTSTSFGFPDVTFCNSSPLRRSVSCPWQREENSARTVSKFCSSANKFSDRELKAITESLDTSMAELEVQDPKRLQEMFFERTDLMMDCRFFEKDCSIESVWNRDMKGCFTFNERRMIAQVPSLRNLSEAELEDLLKNRLELVLDPQVHEYLPSTSEVGFLVLIKNPGTSPSPPSDAVFVPPGYTTYIGLTLVRGRFTHPTRSS
ncbi:FMRFamide-activated amiloride-sensitive sodium channel-like [Amblyomma americanum]